MDLEFYNCANNNAQSSKVALQNIYQLLPHQSGNRRSFLLGIQYLLRVQVQSAYHWRVYQTTWKTEPGQRTYWYFLTLFIGYPLSYSFSIQNKFVEKDGEVYYSFQVSGPKSKVDVEMTAGAATAG